jgi:uncharacterized repeat protein (TIGR03803 family)
MGRASFFYTVSYAALLSGMAVADPAAASPSEVVLLSFSGSNGSTPVASPTFDPYNSTSKMLYGTTSAGGDLTKCDGKGCGTVFELIPPATGKTNWTEKVLYEFQGGTDGAAPTGSVIFDKSGVIYGTTSAGGVGKCFNYDFHHPSSGSYHWTRGKKLGCGTVFSLTPPARGKTVWTKTILHKFEGGSDGRQPPGNLMMDKTGALYGVTSGGGGGTCYLLSCGYFAFNSGFPYPMLQFNTGPGAVFRLTPPAAGHKVWTEELLYSFQSYPDGTNPTPGVQSSDDGGLYGTTVNGGKEGAGTVYKLTPSSSGGAPWKETILYSFGKASTDGIHPNGPLHLDAGTDGGLVGTTSNSSDVKGYGTVFKLKPPSSGSSTWRETIAYDFSKSAGFPSGGLNLDKATDTYYTTTSGGGEGECQLGCGTVVSLSPPSADSDIGWKSVVLHKFGVGTDGKDPVAGMVRDAAGNLYGTTSAGGTKGMGTVFKITP